MADEIKLKAPTVEQQVVVNISGEDKLEKFADTLDKISKGRGLQKYWKDQQTLINDTIKAYDNFNKSSSQADATELIKTTNALKAMAGVDISSLIPDFNKFTSALSKAEGIAGHLTDAFTEKAFRDAFSSFETLKAYGVDLENFFKHFEFNADVDKLVADLSNANAAVTDLKSKVIQLEDRLQESESGNGIRAVREECESLRWEIELIRNEAAETFSAFLTSNNINASSYKYEEFFERIREGSLTAQEAIAEFKRDYAYLLESGASFDTTQLQDFSKKLDDVLKKISGVSEKIDYISSNGVKVNDFGSGGSGNFEELANVVNQIENTNANSNASAIYESLSKILTAIKEIGQCDTDNLYHIYATIRNLAQLNDLKVNKTSLDNLANCLERICRIDNTSALTNLSMVDLKKFNDLHISKASLNNLAEYLPQITNVDVRTLIELANIDFEKLNTLHIDKNSMRNLFSFIEGLRNATGLTDFSAENKKVESSAKSSTGGLKTEAELMESIATNAERAAKAKREFVEANKELAKATETSTDALSKENSELGEMSNKSNTSSPIDAAVPTDSFDKILSKLDLTKSKLGEIVKITKQTRIDADGKPVESYTLKDKYGSTEIYGESSNPQLLRSNIVEYDTKQAKALVDENIRINKSYYDAKKKEEQEYQKLRAKFLAEGKAQEDAYNAQVIKEQSEVWDKNVKAIQEYMDANTKLNQLKAKDKGTGKHAREIAFQQKEVEKLEASALEAKKTLLSVMVGSDSTQIDDWRKWLDMMNQFDQATKGSARSVAQLEDSLRNMAKSQLDNIQKTLAGHDDYYKKIKPSEGDRDPKFQEAIQNYGKAIDALREFNSTLDASTPLTNQQSAAYESLLGRLRETRLEIESFSAAERGSNEDSRTKEIDKLTKYLDKNTKISKEAKQQLQGYLNLLKSGDPSVNVKKIHTEWTNVAIAERQAGREGKSFFSILKNKSIHNYAAQLVGYYLSFMDIIRYGKQVVNIVREIDTAMTELEKVSGETTSRLEENLKNSAKTAKDLGASISDVISATADWAKTGYNIDQSEELARVSTLYVNVGDGINVEDANNSLISTLQGFRLDTDEAESIIDKFNEVSNNYAIDSAGIGEALQRSAASFNAANTDLSKSIALITATNEVVQDPESVGTLWKTMSARIRGASTELSELGEETDEYTESTSKLRDLVKGLTGFDIMLDENTFKDVYEIILGIGQEWENLTDVEQASLGEALAGKRNANALYAVLGNLDTLQGAYKTAEESAGSAMREQERYEQHIEHSIKRLTASTQEWATTLLDSDLIKWFVDLANAVVEFSTALSPLMTIGLGAGIFKAFKGLGSIKSSLPMLTDVVAQLKAVSVGSVGTDGLFDDPATVAAYTAQLRGLSTTQAKVAMTSAGLTKAQRAQIMTSLEATAATQTLTTQEVVEAMTRKLGNAEKAKELLMKAELVTATELEAGAEIQVSATKIDSAVASGLLSKAEAANIKTALGLEVTNVGLSASFKMLALSIWESVKAMAAWLFTTPAGWATLAVGIIVGAIVAYNKWGDTLENAQENLEDSIGVFNETTEKIKSLNDELNTTKERIEELQKLSDEGTISIADEAELETLKKQNKELARQIALEQRKQIIEGKKALDDAKDVSTESVTSKYKTKTVGTANPTVIGENVSPEEELQLAINAHEEAGKAVEKWKAELSRDDITDRERKNAEIMLGIEEDRLSSAEARVDEMYGILDAERQAYLDLEEAGYTLDNESKNRLKDLNKINDTYLLWNHTLTQTQQSFESLNAEQQRSILLGRLLKQGLSEEDANAVLNSISDDDLSEYWSKDFSFTPPDYTTAEEYGKAYAKAWLGGAKSETQNSNKISFSSVWESASEDTKDKLLELAKAGELTPETLESTEEYKELLTQTGLGAEEFVEKITNLLTTSDKLSTFVGNMKSLSSAYADFKDNKFVSIDNIDSMKEVFGDLSSFESFATIAGDASSSAKEIQQVFNNLATEYLNSNNILDEVTESNRGYIETQLRAIGIENAHELVLEKLNADKQALANKDQAIIAFEKDLANGTIEASNSFLKQANMTDFARFTLVDLIAQQKIFNEEGLSVDEQIDSLSQLALSYMGAAAQASFLNKVRSGGLNVNYRISAEEAWAQTLDEFAKLDTEIEFTSPTDKDPKDKDKTDETFDWIEIRLEKLAARTEKFKQKFEDAFTLDEIDDSYKKVMTAIRKEIEFTEKAADKYAKKANKIDLPKKYKKKIRNGSLDIEKITNEDLKKKMEEYQDYYNKSKEAKKSKKELKKEESALAMQYGDKILDRFEGKTNLRKSKTDRNNSLLELYDSQGKDIGSKDYRDLRNANVTLADEEVTGAKAALDKYKLWYKENKKDLSKEDKQAAKINIQNLKAEYNEAKKIKKEANEAIFEDDMQLAKWEQDEINSRAESLESDIALKEAQGLSASKKDYQQRISISKEAITNLETQNGLLKTQQEGLEENSAKYQELQADINANDEAIKKAKQSQTEWNNAIDGMKLDGFQKFSELLNIIISRFEKFKTLAELHGNNISDEKIDKQFGLLDESNRLNAGIKEGYLDDIKRIGASANFTPEQIQQIIEFAEAGRTKDIETLVTSLGKDWAELGEFSEAINSYTSAYDAELDNAIEAENLLDMRWDNEIDKINEITEAYQKQKEIKDRQLATEKAIYDLEKAKSNLNKKVWNGEEWVYAADQEAIQSAQEAYDNNQQEELINALGDLTEALEKEKEDRNLYDDDGNPNFTKESVQAAVAEILANNGLVLHTANSLPTVDGGTIDYTTLASTLAASGYMPQFVMPSQSYETVRNSNSITIQNLEISMPNINDSSTARDMVEGLRSELVNLGTYAKQFNWNS